MYYTFKVLKSDYFPCFILLKPQFFSFPKFAKKISITLIKKKSFKQTIFFNK